MHRASPWRAASPKTRRAKHTLRLYKKSPLVRRTRARHRESLVAIREASPSPFKRVQNHDHSIRYDTDVVHDEEHADEEDACRFQWEDERTLVSDLLEDNDFEESVEHSHDKLVESMQTHFSEQGYKIIDEIAKTLVPAVDKVKKCHRFHEEVIDVIYGQGILTFDSASKAVEMAALKEDETLRNSYSLIRRDIERLLGELEQIYAAREQRWKEFKLEFDTIANELTESIKELPAQIERTIMVLEKQSKQITKAEGSSSGKMLKGLLEKLG